jgi:hypothetical protein
VSLFSVYFDEDAMNTHLVLALRQRGVPTLTPIEENLIGSSDEEQLLFASRRICVLYTFNVCDFYPLHTAWLSTAKHHAGMILVPQQRLSVGEQLRRILRLRATKSAEAMRDSVEFSQ